MMVDVVILRGLPGSGKDQYVRYVLRKNYVKPGGPLGGRGEYLVFSNDSFFMDGGKYVFCKDELPLARKACFGQFKYELESSVEKQKHKLLVVSNSNAFAWEMAPYVALAELNGIDARIITLYKRPFDRGNNGVMNIELVKMWKQFEWDIPWDQEIVKR